MPSECCDEYKLIQLYQKSSVWCFAFSHTSTFELIPSVATAQPGAMVTIVGEYGSFPYRSVTVVAGSAPASLQCSLNNWYDFSDTSRCTLTEIRRTVQHTGHYVWKKETSEYLIPTEVQPAYEPAVIERYRFEARVHGVQQVETAATSTMAMIHHARGHHRGTGHSQGDQPRRRRDGASVRFLTYIYLWVNSLSRHGSTRSHGNSTLYGVRGPHNFWCAPVAQSATTNFGTKVVTANYYRSDCENSLYKP